MTDRQPLHKNNRMIFTVLVAIMAGITLLYVLILREQLLPGWLITHKALIFVLWYLDATLLIIFAFILIRYLVKLILERRSKTYASRLRTRVALSLTGMILVPVLYLVFIAIDLILHANSVPRDLKSVAEASRNLAQAYTAREAGEIRELGHTLTLQLKGKSPQTWPDVVSEYMSGSDLTAVEVYQDRRPLFSNVRPPMDNQGSFQIPGSFLKEIDQYGEGILVEKKGQVWLIRIGLTLPQKQALMEIVISRSMDGTLGEDRATVLNTAQALDQLRLEQTTLTMTRILIFVLLTLGMTFGALWYGTTLSRYLTQPLKDLLEATRRVASGDFQVHVEEAPSDEWHTLISQFNEMTGELQQTRSLLLKERTKLQQILEITPVGIVAMDSTGKVNNANPAARAILNLPLETQNLQDLPQEIKDLLHSRDESTHGHSKSSLTLDGAYLEIGILPLPDGGKLLVVEDLTQLVRAQKMATWQEAAKQIAHELKNPLTPIKLSAERLLLRSRSSEPDESLIEGTCNTILQEVDHLKGLVDGFLQYARLPSPTPRLLDIQEIFRNLADLYKDIKPGVSILMDCEPGVVILADPQLLRQALTNLLDNAVEACSAGQTVTLQGNQSKEGVILRIADEGRGIPEKDREHIFRPYFSTKGRGSGLGLSIVHRVIQDHGGTIHVENNKPRGTVFTITMPLVELPG
ncbi:MAG TPA: ATP-binding protein [Thermoanaerobaculia bacterium]|nr:ATP-binding protein [Thermoanaerobaculia bacterium]HUM30245.1 ATP-binding protein [Thermoanaerobaculia bacterium]HXK68459.1 ATP-binding protein [Thermoanaerobaculia bacterium]